MRELRNIVENHIGQHDIEFCQRKISAAGEMKSAIKRAIAEAEWRGDGYQDHEEGFLVPKQRVNELVKAMEAYLNAV